MMFTLTQLLNKQIILETIINNILDRFMKTVKSFYPSLNIIVEYSKCFDTSTFYFERDIRSVELVTPSPRPCLSSILCLYFSFIRASPSSRSLGVFVDRSG